MKIKIIFSLLLLKISKYELIIISLFKPLWNNNNNIGINISQQNLFVISLTENAEY